MSEKVALIAGVTGAVGSALARELTTSPDWQVIGLSRHAPKQPLAGVNYLNIDLNYIGEYADGSQSLSSVTHVYYCGRATHAEQLVENASDNLKLLSNLLNVVEKVAARLEHVHLVQGGKYYGVHIGPFPTPAQEDDARAPIVNFNYDQQDFLIHRSSQATWSWSASRPNTLIHYSPANARNLVSTLGAYAAICRELGAALDFPGNQGAYESITQVTSIDLLARGIHWMTTTERCANQAFNLTNTDVFRWQDLWPQLASAFDMPVGTVRPMRVADIFQHHDPVWRQLSERHKLKISNLELVANWSFADATLERHWDEILCHNKTREYGFHDWGQSQRSFFEVLHQYRDAGILPG